MIETMTAYENYEYNMDLIEDMFRYVAKEAFEKTEFNVHGHVIDFGKPWKRISMSQAVLETTGIDFAKCSTVDEANSHLTSLSIDETQTSIGLALAKAFEEKVEQTLINPTLIFGHPIDISPLAKPMDSDPTKAERFEIFIAGMECGDNWSEQNDPMELLQRWKSNYKPEDRDSGEFHPLDYDFIELLEYGIPPTTGIGPGIERMAMILNEQENIDDVIFFPIMKPIISQANKEIYDISEDTNSYHSGDVVITMEEVEEFVMENDFQEDTSNITIRPILRFWKKQKKEENFKASGYIEIGGFLNNRLLKIAGYKVRAEKELNQKDELNKFKQYIEKNILDIFSKFIIRSKIELVEPLVIL